MKTILFLVALAAVLTGCTNVQSYTSPDFASNYADPIYDESQVTVAPRLIQRPDFGAGTPRTGSASTVLSVIIQPDGVPVVENVISQSEGPFTIAAIKSIQAAKFYPGQINGRIVTTRMKLPLHFNKSPTMNGLVYINGDAGAKIETVNTPSYDISGK